LCMPFRAWWSTVFSSGWRLRRLSPAATASRQFKLSGKSGSPANMKFQNRIRHLAAAVVATVALAVAMPAFAQEISESHLKAARDAVASINATDSFDGILPQAAAALQASLIQKNPDLQELISS